MTISIKTVIADDHTLFRMGLRHLIESLPELKVVAEFENGKQLLEQIQSISPSVAVIDHDLPGASGLDAASKIRAEMPEVRILILTGMNSEEILHDYYKLEVNSIVLKTDNDNTLLRGLKAAYLNTKYYSPAVQDLIERSLAGDRLTSRERQVIRHIAKGLSNNQIAEVMGISPKTVGTHRTNMMNKLDLHTVAEVVTFAVRSKLI